MDEYNASAPFFTKGGKQLNSLKELWEYLQSIDEKAFKQYPVGDESPFALWVEKVFDDHFLSARMKRAKTRKELEKILFIYLHK